MEIEENHPLKPILDNISNTIDIIKIVQFIGRQQKEIDELKEDNKHLNETIVRINDVLISTAEVNTTLKKQVEGFDSLKVGFLLLYDYYQKGKMIPPEKEQILINIKQLLKH